VPVPPPASGRLPPVGAGSEQHRHSGARQRAHVAARRQRSLEDRGAIGVHGKTVGDRERCDPVWRAVGQGNGHDTTEREAAKVGAINPKGIERGEHRLGEAVVRGGVTCGRRVAFAVARMIERDRAPLRAEMGKLARPGRLVGADAVQKDDRRRITAAVLVDADCAEAGVDARHASACSRAAGLLQGGAAR